MRDPRGAAPTRRRSFLRTLLTSAGACGLSLGRAEAALGASQKTSADDEIRHVSDEWFEALRQTNLAAIDRLEADDFLTVQEASVGVAVIEKATQLASLKTGKDKPVRRWRELSKVRIRHYADTAILTGVAVFRRDAAAPQTPPSQAVITEIWIRQSNRWRIAHFATHPVHDRVKR